MRSRRLTWRLPPISCNNISRHSLMTTHNGKRWSPMIFCGNLPMRLPSAIQRGSLGGRRSCVTWIGSGSGGEFPLLRHQGVRLRRSWSGSRRIQGGGAHQAYGTNLSSGLCAVPACCSRQDCIPTRIFWPRACGQGLGRTNSWSRILRTSGDWQLALNVRLRDAYREFRAYSRLGWWVSLNFDSLADLSKPCEAEK
jgi:hypothetical protein